MEEENDIEAEIDDETGEVRVRPAPPAPSPPPPPPARVRSNGNGASRRSTGVGATAQTQQTPSTQPVTPEAPSSKDAPWSTNQADQVWDEMNGAEHPRSLAKLGKTAFDTKITMARTVRGARDVVLTMSGNDVQGGGDMSPGDMLRQRGEDMHVALSEAPETYDVDVTWRPGSTFYGRGLKLSFPSRGEIVARRGVQRSAQGGNVPPAGYGQPFQPPYAPQAPPYAPQQPPQAQQPPVGYGAGPQYAPGPAYQPHSQQSSHDPEVSNLRTEVAGLAGAVKGMMDYMREEREYARGQRQTPPTPPQAPQMPPQQPPQGFGAPPQGWPRRPGYERTREDDLQDELDDLRAEVNAMHRRGGPGPGFGGAPPQATAQPPAAPVQPPPVPKGPRGEVWVERVGWCIPADQAQAAAAPAVQPVAAVAQSEPAPAPARTAGVGAAPDAFAGVESQFRTMIAGMQSTVMRRVEKEMRDALSGVQTGLGQAEDPEPEPPPPPDPGASLPFDVIDMPGQDLWGHPLKYAASKETGRIDLEGFVMSNPGVLEKGAEVLGALVEIGSTFAKKAAQATNLPRMGAQLPAAAGVGQSPPQQAQVVDNIPEEAQPAATQGGAGSGSFPAV